MVTVGDSWEELSQILFNKNKCVFIEKHTYSLIENLSQQGTSFIVDNMFTPLLVFIVYALFPSQSSQCTFFVHLSEMWKSVTNMNYLICCITDI